MKCVCGGRHGIEECPIEFGGRMKDDAQYWEGWSSGQSLLKTDLMAILDLVSSAAGECDHIVARDITDGKVFLETRENKFCPDCGASLNESKEGE